MCSSPGAVCRDVRLCDATSHLVRVPTKPPVAGPALGATSAVRALAVGSDFSLASTHVCPQSSSKLRQLEPQTRCEHADSVAACLPHAPPFPRREWSACGGPALHPACIASCGPGHAPGPSGCPHMVKPSPLPGSVLGSPVSAPSCCAHKQGRVLPWEVQVVFQGPFVLLSVYPVGPQTSSCTPLPSL